MEEVVKQCVFKLARRERERERKEKEEIMDLATKPHILPTGSRNRGQSAAGEACSAGPNRIRSHIH